MASANLAQAFGLPVPPFQIAFLDYRLVDGFSGVATSELKGAHVFKSLLINKQDDFVEKNGFRGENAKKT